MNRNRLPTVNSVDNIPGEVVTAEVWRDHYESILNCVDQRKYKNKVTTTLCYTIFDSGVHVPVAEIADAINTKMGKSSGSDGLTGEAFIYWRQCLSLDLASILTYSTQKIWLMLLSCHSLKTKRQTPRQG